MGKMRRERLYQNASEQLPAYAAEQQKRAKTLSKM
jgi:hypothetical protein